MKIGEAALSRLLLVLLKVPFKLVASGGGASICGREIVNFHDAVVGGGGGLPVRHGHNEEFRLKLLHSFTLSKHGWHHVAVSWVAQTHHFSIFALSKHVVSFQGLAQVGYLVDFHPDVSLRIRLNHYGHKLGNFKAKRMVKLVLVFERSSPSQFITS